MFTDKHLQKNLGESRRQIVSILMDNDPLIDCILGRERRTAEYSFNKEEIKAQTQDLSYLVNQLHPADLADLLEGLPIDERLVVWRLVKKGHRGKILLEVSKPVWDTLIDDMSDKDLFKAIKTLDVDEQVYLTEFLAPDLKASLLASMEVAQRERVRGIIDYPLDTIGRLMDFEFLTVKPDVTLSAVQRFLRIRKNIPDGTDKLFVIDTKNHLIGALPLATVLQHEPETKVSDVMIDEPVSFHPEDKDTNALSAFERYDLISAPVVDARGCLMGRITIERVMDAVNEDNDTNIRRLGGLSEEEDVFAPVAKTVKIRWAWLAINLCTAFVASRVIGLFESTISQQVALASLMPIVAGIGGNTGNQTITMIVRALALHQVEINNIPRLMLRELGVAVINGVVWGGVMGTVTYFLYGNLLLGLVMLLAMLLNLLVAAMMGVLVPMLMLRFGRDPAVGSSVMITAMTDTGGFFIFLGLAALLL